MSDPDDLITLRTGKQVPRPLVRTTFLTLDRLFNDDPVPFYELAACCKDRTHVLFGNCGAKLVEAGMLRQVNRDGTGMVHDAVRDVVEAATEGEGFEMRLRWPVEPEGSDA